MVHYEVRVDGCTCMSIPLSDSVERPCSNWFLVSSMLPARALTSKRTTWILEHRVCDKTTAMPSRFKVRTSEDGMLKLNSVR